MSASRLATRDCPVTPASPAYAKAGGSNLGPPKLLSSVLHRQSGGADQTDCHSQNGAAGTSSTRRIVGLSTPGAGRFLSIERAAPFFHLCNILRVRGPAPSHPPRQD